MNSDSIKRSVAIKALHEEWDGGWLEVTGEWIADNCEAVLNRLPSADRPQGEWIDYSGEGYVECPFCHSATTCDGNKDELHFCFSCGADMRGDIK